LYGQTILWHNSVLDSLADSSGNSLDSSFSVELGTFKDGFSPLESQVADWHSNWLVFDVAAFNPGLGYFTGEAVMNASGTTDSPPMTPGAPSFEGKTAYIWVRRGTQAVPMSEWMLVSDASWVFPKPDPACCPNGQPLEWAISDLDGNDVPKFGSQGGVTGPGVQYVSGTYVIQTHTFVPEPAVLGLCLASLWLGCLRRR
jgi:hypothetical protein